MKSDKAKKILKIVIMIIIMMTLLLMCNESNAAKGRPTIEVDDSGSTSQQKMPPGKQKPTVETDDFGSSSQQSQSTEPDLESGAFSDWQGDADEFFERAEDNEEKSGLKTSEIIEIFLPIGRFLVGVASIVLVVVGLIMGVKYMISGSNEKAQLKQKLIYYVVSIVLVYGAVGIFNLIVNIINAVLG